MNETSLILVRQLAWLLLGTALVGMLARWVQIPYAVALVLVGLLIEQTHFVAVPHLEPGLVLFVFLPPILFDGAFRIDSQELRRMFRPVLLLALPGTLVTALLVSAVLVLGLGLPLSVSLLFGSIVAATDPVAVLAVFRHLQAPPRLAIIAEGESLINDGVAIALYATFSAFALGAPPGLLGMVELFGRQLFGGVLIGVLFGLVFSRLTALIDDHLIEMTLSTALAYGSYLVAQEVSTSGPLATVAAGIVHGTYGRQIGMSENTRRLLDDLWEYLGFLANGLVFLLVGLSVNVGVLLATAWPVTVAIVAVLLARLLVLAAPELLPPPVRLSLSRAERLVLLWAGLRGALTIALALALPAETPARDLLIAMAFGVVLFTLVVQGLTISLVLRRVGLAGRT